jgi:hypothetical protein
VRHSALCDGSDKQLASLFGDIEKRKRGQYLAVDRALVRPVLCALLSLLKLFALLLGHALPFALNRRFLIPLGLRGRFLRAPLGCLGLRYAPSLSCCCRPLRLCLLVREPLALLRYGATFPVFGLNPGNLGAMLSLRQFPRSPFLGGDPLRLGLLRPRLSLNALILNPQALTFGCLAGDACLLGCAALCGLLGCFGSGFLAFLDGALLCFGA